CRTPYRWLRALIVGKLTTVFGVAVDEDQALDRVRQGILQSARVACARRKTRHPLWSELHQSLQADVPRLVEPAFADARRRQMREKDQRLASVAKSVETAVTASTVLVNVLRVSRLVLDVAAVWAAYLLCGWSTWTIILAVFLLGLVDDLIRLACSRYV